MKELEEIAVCAALVVLVVLGLRVLAGNPRGSAVFPDALNDDVDPDPVGGPLH